MTASTPIIHSLTSHKRRRFRVVPLNALQDTVKPKIHPAVVCHRFDETEDNIKSAETSLHSRQEDEIREDTVEISIYRREWEVADADADQDSMWTLKRANPICDSDDEEDHIYESPTKRSRKTLELHDSILKPDEPFVLKNYISFD